MASDIVALEDWLPQNPDVEEQLARIQSIRESARSLNQLYRNGFRDVPGYLGSGRDKHAFRVGQHVLKIQALSPESSFAAQVNPLRRALGISGVEQLVALSERSETIVADFVPGTMPALLGANTLARRYINPVSVGALQSTLGEMQEAGVYVDGPTNLLADGKTISIIDPADNPRYGVNDFDAVAGLIAGHQMPRYGSMGKRSAEEYLTIRNAIQAQRLSLQKKQA